MLNVSQTVSLLAFFVLSACSDVTILPRGSPPDNPPGAARSQVGGVVEVGLVDARGIPLGSNTHRCDVYVGIPNALGWQYAFGSFTPNTKAFWLTQSQWEIAKSEYRLMASFEITQSYARQRSQREFILWFRPRSNYAAARVKLPPWCRQILRGGNPYDQFHLDGTFPYQRKGYRWYY